MPFADFLKATVLLSAGAATALAAVTVVGAGQVSEPRIALLSIGWWAVASVIGMLLGRRNETTPPIARLLAGARAATTLPEPRPWRVVVNRLWPLLLSTVSAGAVGFVAPQVPGIAAGFAIIWALAWRRQHSAVIAIEHRDGVRFHVELTSPVRPMSLTRTPGFKAYIPQQQRQRAA
jgi:hypothetical protein